MGHSGKFLGFVRQFAGAVYEHLPVTVDLGAPRPEAESTARADYWVIDRHDARTAGVTEPRSTAPSAAVGIAAEHAAAGYRTVGSPAGEISRTGVG